MSKESKKGALPLQKKKRKNFGTAKSTAFLTFNGKMTENFAAKHLVFSVQVSSSNGNFVQMER